VSASTARIQTAGAWRNASGCRSTAAALRRIQLDATNLVENDTNGKTDVSCATFPSLTLLIAKAYGEGGERRQFVHQRQW
jgi:hypothetical protein